MMTDLTPTAPLTFPSLDSAKPQAAHIPFSAIAATTDVGAISAWLAACASSRATFDSYRREAERLLLWARIERGGANLADLKLEDFQQYAQFLANPQPAEKWVASGGRKYPRSDPRWRPFYGLLSTASQKMALHVINSMMSWLASAGYLKGNPLSLARKKGPPQSQEIQRYLTPETWADVKAYVDELPAETLVEVREKARARWLLSLMYLTALRLSEMINAEMGDVFYTRAKDGTVRWWLYVMGKGKKERNVPLGDEFLAELNLYRVSLGLHMVVTGRAPIAPGSDPTPLVQPLRSRGQKLTRAAGHQMIKKLFLGAAERIKRLHPEDVPRVERLEQASAHWIRHTAGSDMANSGVDLLAIRDNFGHASLTTTNRYLHKESEARHDATVGKHRVSW